MDVFVLFRLRQQLAGSRISGHKLPHGTKLFPVQIILSGCRFFQRRLTTRKLFLCVSRKQRYNKGITLDLASKIDCQQGCSRPYWKPGAKELCSSGHSIIFDCKRWQNP